MKTIILLAVLTATGCCSLCEEEEIKPLPPEKLKDLRFIHSNWAYKSVTKEDYEIKEINYWPYLELYEGVNITR